MNSASPTPEQTISVERRPGPGRARGEGWKSRRASVELTVQFRRGNIGIHATAKNLSIGGMFIETMQSAPFGDTVIVDVPLPGFVELASIACVVRWTNDEGMGVQFGAMGARETHALLRVLQP